MHCTSCEYLGFLAVCTYLHVFLHNFSIQYVCLICWLWYFHGVHGWVKWTAFAERWTVWHLSTQYLRTKYQVTEPSSYPGYFRAPHGLSVGAPGNIQGNRDRYGVEYSVLVRWWFMKFSTYWIWHNVSCALWRKIITQLTMIFDWKFSCKLYSRPRTWPGGVFPNQRSRWRHALSRLKYV